MPSSRVCSQQPELGKDDPTKVSRLQLASFSALWDFNRRPSVLLPALMYNALRRHKKKVKTLAKHPSAQLVKVAQLGSLITNAKHAQKEV